MIKYILAFFKYFGTMFVDWWKIQDFQKKITIMIFVLFFGASGFVGGKYFEYTKGFVNLNTVFGLEFQGKEFDNVYVVKKDIKNTKKKFYNIVDLGNLKYPKSIPLGVITVQEKDSDFSTVEFLLSCISCKREIQVTIEEKEKPTVEKETFDMLCHKDEKPIKIYDKIENEIHFMFWEYKNGDLLRFELNKDGSDKKESKVWIIKGNCQKQ